MSETQTSKAPLLVDGELVDYREIRVNHGCTVSVEIEDKSKSLWSRRWERITEKPSTVTFGKDDWAASWSGMWVRSECLPCSNRDIDIIRASFEGKLLERADP